MIGVIPDVQHRKKIVQLEIRAELVAQLNSVASGYECDCTSDITLGWRGKIFFFGEGRGIIAA